MFFRRLMVFFHPGKHFLVYYAHTTGVIDVMANTFPVKPNFYVSWKGNFIMITKLHTCRQTHKLVEVWLNTAHILPPTLRLLIKIFNYTLT